MKTIARILLIVGAVMLASSMVAYLMPKTKSWRIKYVARDAKSIAQYIESSTPFKPKSNWKVTLKTITIKIVKSNEPPMKFTVKYSALEYSIDVKGGMIFYGGGEVGKPYTTKRKAVAYSESGRIVVECKPQIWLNIVNLPNGRKEYILHVKIVVFKDVKTIPKGVEVKPLETKAIVYPRVYTIKGTLEIYVNEVKVSEIGTLQFNIRNNNSIPSNNNGFNDTCS